MTARRFTPAEIGAAGRGLVPIARALEAYAAQTPQPRDGLVDRIMPAVGTRPQQTPAAARQPRVAAQETPTAMLWRALHGRSLHSILDELAALTGTALGVGRWVPVAVRAQAIAILLTVAFVVVGSGAALAAGAAGIVDAIRRPVATAPGAPPAEPADGTHDTGREKRPHGKSHAGRGDDRGRGGGPAYTTAPGRG